MTVYHKGLKDGLYAVDVQGICAGFVVEGGLVTQCAPILARKLWYWVTKGEWICE